jgi:hypothetical protein
MNALYDIVNGKDGPMNALDGPLNGVLGGLNDVGGLLFCLILVLTGLLVLAECVASQPNCRVALA